MTRIVLVGAGHAHVEVLRRFAQHPEPGVRLTLLTRHRTTPYSGLLHAVVAGDVPREAALIDCAALAHQAGADLIVDALTGLDPSLQIVRREHGPPLAYDLLSLDVGSTPNTGRTPGADRHAIPVKPIDGFLDRLAALRAVASDHQVTIAIVGAGAAGTELSFAVRRGFPPGTRVMLVAGGDDLLPGFPERLRRRIRARCRTAGIDVVTGAMVTAVADGRLTLADGRSLDAGIVLWTTQAAAPRWLADTGLALDADGFLRVDATLQAVGRPGIFAAGDVASFDPRPLPKSGVYAVRQGPVLADNLRRAARGMPPEPFRPQRNALYLLSTGRDDAVGAKGSLVISGWWVKRLKTWLDESFMGRYPRAVR